MAPATARDDVALAGALSHKTPPTPAAATWENRRKCPVAAKYNYNGCGRPDRCAEGRRRQTGREGGLVRGRQLKWHVKRNEMTARLGTAWREGERDHAPLDIVGKKKFPPPAASPPLLPLFPSASVRYHSVLSFGVGVGRHRKRRRSRLICPNGLCLRPREQDHKNSETAQEGERERGRERAGHRPEPQPRGTQLATHDTRSSVFAGGVLLRPPSRFV